MITALKNIGKGLLLEYHSLCHQSIMSSYDHLQSIKVDITKGYLSPRVNNNLFTLGKSDLFEMRTSDFITTNSVSNQEGDYESKRHTSLSTQPQLIQNSPFEAANTTEINNTLIPLTHLTTEKKKSALNSNFSTVADAYPELTELIKTQKIDSNAKSAILLSDKLERNGNDDLTGQELVFQKVNSFSDFGENISSVLTPPKILTKEEGSQFSKELATPITNLTDELAMKFRSDPTSDESNSTEDIQPAKTATDLDTVIDQLTHHLTNEYYRFYGR